MNNTTTSTTPTLMAIDQPGCRINSDTPQMSTSDVPYTPNAPVGAIHNGDDWELPAADEGIC